MKRVLMFTPTNRLEPEALGALLSVEYSGPLDRLIARDNPETKQLFLNIVYNYQKAQRICLAEGYDALFTVESDVLIPPYALERLLAIDADIAYGVYAFRQGAAILNITHPRTYASFSFHMKEWKALFGQVIECSGLGYGCTLIQRRVLEQHAIHTESDGGDSDTVLARWARENGIRQMADTSVICGHKRPDRVTLWPERDRIRQEGTRVPILRAVRSLIPFSGWTDDNEMYICRPGDPPICIDYERAQILVGANMAEYTD
jgi:hypothetical protein